MWLYAVLVALSGLAALGSVLLYRRAVSGVKSELVKRLIASSVASGYAAFVAAILDVVLDVFPLFLFLLTLFVMVGSLTIIAARHEIEEQVVGSYAVVRRIRIGDYVEIGNVAGHVVAKEDTGIVIRDTRRGLLYIPYSDIVEGEVRRVDADEGFEVRIFVDLPIDRVDLEAIRRSLEPLANNFEVRNLRVDVDAIKNGSVRLVIRGIMFDVRKRDEFRYAVLDRVYSLVYGGGKGVA